MCHICELNEQIDALPIRERLYVGEHWRISHAWSSLPGWLVCALRRHTETLDELTVEEASALGPILRAASFALKQEVGCTKTYVMLFAERQDYAHVHLHIVPRMDWFDQEDSALGVFRFLNVPESEQVSADRREQLAIEIGRTIQHVLG